MTLPPGFIDDLRGRIPLSRIVGRRVTWDGRKSNAGRGDFWAPCPFHQEQTPSFHVDDAKGFYYCFGCQAKGDALDFLRETENLGFMEAVEMLAREAGLPMPARDPAAAARVEAQSGLVAAMEAATAFFRLNLAAARGAEARAYLDRRGLTPATRDTFEIGYAPDARGALLEHLTQKGFTPRLLAEAGLVGLPEDGGAPYDRFRGRVMFPIRDARGRAIGFGARALRDGQQPKYLNSPDTPLFDKGRSLYNVAAARAAAGKAGTVIVVEGYMDAIALAQAGLTHVTAALGTAVTEAHLQALWRITPEPVVALDGDRAGLAAAQRMIDLALPLMGAGRALRFVLLPQGQDPDDVVRAGGAAAMQALVAGSRPLVDLLWSRETEGTALDSPERRTALDARLRAHLARITDAGLRAHYQAEFRDRRRALFTPQRPGPRAPFASGRKPALVAGQATAAARASLLACAAPGTDGEARIRESVILAGCLAHPALVARFEDRLDRMPFRCADLAEIRDALLFAAASCPHGEILSSETLIQALTVRLGRDPCPEVAALGQVRASRHLQAGGDAELAGRAIEEELVKHAAFHGRLSEVSDASEELTRETAESFTWRLRQAAEASESAVTRPLAESRVQADAELAMSAQLQGLIDTEVWKKPPRR